MPITRISEGMSNQYLVPGVGLMIIGLLFLLASTLIALPLIIIAIALLIVKTGVMIDPVEKKYKNFRSTFGITFGQWHSYKDVTEVVLILSTEQSTLRGILPGAVPIGRSAKLHVRTYDLIIKYGIDSVQINDFLTYKNARKTLVALTASLGIEGRDFVAEKIASNRARRST